MHFYLGTSKPVWLSRLDVPLFISTRPLSEYRTMPRARTTWALDSGGFTELSMHGEWKTSEAEYVAQVRRYISEVGNLEWCAPQDWMCEPHILAKTGLTVAEHQRRTVRSYLSLRDQGLPVIPVLQGWETIDYLHCIEMYETEGVALTEQPRVGVGSVCRRQNTAKGMSIFATLADHGIRCHGFGVKIDGLKWYGQWLVSADSMAWSMVAWRHMLTCGEHRNCANCAEWALLWRELVLTGRKYPPDGTNIREWKERND